MSEEVVNSDINVRKRRKSGEGSLKNYNNTFKSELYKNYYSQTVPAKKPSKENIGIEQLRIMTVILLDVANDIFDEIGQKYLVTNTKKLQISKAQ